MIWYMPVIGAGFYCAGGQWNKWFRWGMGLPIGLLSFLSTHHWTAFLCIPTYWVATSVFVYGEHSWLNIFSDGEKFFICGIAYGLASAPILLWWSVMQAIISGVSFVVIKALDDSGKLKEPWCELARGFMGAICLIK